MSRARQRSRNNESKQLATKTKSPVVRLTEIAVALGAFLGALYALGTKVVEIQRLFPDFYYGLAADTCSNSSDYPTALRAGNTPLVRCLVEKQGQSTTAVIPAGNPHAN